MACRVVAAAFVLLLAGIVLLARIPAAQASTNIAASPTTNHWAWNDSLGWIDFYNTNTVNVLSSGLTGYANSAAGSISLDCHTSPHTPSNICSSGNGNYQVLNDGVGNLSGWAWNDAIGWISFWCGNGGTGCGTSSYRVTIDSGGNFQGFAWNDTVGWIDFNCDNINNPSPGSCSKSTFEVQTVWVATSTTGSLDSTTFDTGVAQGAQLNSIAWQGSLPVVGTAVAFQLAVATSSGGPWNFTGPGGSTSTSDVWPGGSSGTQVELVPYTLYQNFRYFRYRVILTSNLAQTQTPRVDDVIVSWSP
jgi:hypothetical protein